MPSSYVVRVIPIPVVRTTARMAFFYEKSSMSGAVKNQIFNMAYIASKADETGHLREI